MKKSQFITVSILVVIATVIIIIGCFGQSPKEQSEENINLAAETLKPMPTIKIEETDAADATEAPEETADESEDPAATAEPTLAPFDFPSIKNADFTQYDNNFTYITTYWKDKTETEAATGYISEGSLERLEGINYAYYQNLDGETWDVTMTFSMHFEDGYTEKTLDLLKENDIKAIFFVDYTYISENPEIVKRMKEEGHIIGNRGIIDESTLKTCTAEEFAEGLLKVEEEYRKLFGNSERMYFYLCDYFSNRSLRVAEKLGYTVVVRTYFYYQTYTTYEQDLGYDEDDFTAEFLAKRFNERGLYKGSIDLFVCEKKIYEALKIFIQYAVDEEVNFTLIERRV